jgi:hypothetical protein
VQVADETLVLIGCDTEVGKEAIQAGMTAKVIGKSVAALSRGFSSSSGDLRAD